MLNPTKTNFSYCYLPKQKSFVIFNELDYGYIYYKDYRINLLSNKKENFSITNLVFELSKIQIGLEFNDPHVYHFAYEYGYVIYGLENLVPIDTPLAVVLKYKNYQLQKPQRVHQKANLEIVKKPELKNYQKLFKKVYHHLLEGDCYQLNLTERFNLKIANSMDYFLKNCCREREAYPAYAHGSFLPSQKLGLMSFSPECLFHIDAFDSKKVKISSMPIKGTMKRGVVTDQKLWQDLIHDSKENAELNMITDLVRNDLAKLGDLESFVSSSKSPLKLPGVLHQFSHIYCYADQGKSLSELMLALFPGGSITGAPKKNVMKLIKKIETSSRRFYCGSTVILHKTLKKASINIRTAEFDFDDDTLEIGSGGGVTLKSDHRREFQELEAKFESVFSYLQ